VIVPELIVSWTWTGPHRVEATLPVTSVVAEPDPDEPLEVPEELPVVPEELPVVVPGVVLEIAAGGEVVEVVAEVEPSYPKSSTTTDRVLRNQNVMRFM
jgi:hypothetical protein